MHKIRLLVRVREGGETTGAYVRQLELPFVPSLGMRFEQGISTRMWETQGGDELSPPVERVMYDLDEEEIVCLFTIDSKLASAFWTELKVVDVEGRCPELRCFRGI